MENIIIPVTFIIVILIITITLRNVIRPSTIKKSSHKPSLTLEQKLSILAECGFELVEPFTSESLLESWNRDDYEQPGFDLVLVGLGMTEEREPWRNHCVSLWHFDTECIEDHGDYKRIAERLIEMTQGTIILENITDYVDIEKGKAWLSYEYLGQPVKVDFQVNDDWVDWRIFNNFAELLEQMDSHLKFVIYSLVG
jgi:hypothetical protein